MNDHDYSGSTFPIIPFLLTLTFMGYIGYTCYQAGDSVGAIAGYVALSACAFPLIWGAWVLLVLLVVGGFALLFGSIAAVCGMGK